MFCSTYPFHHIFRVFNDHYVSGEHFFLEDERWRQILISRQINTKHNSDKNILNIQNIYLTLSYHLPFGKVRMSIYDFHDAPPSTKCILFSRCVTVMAGSIAELSHLRCRGKHE